MAVGRVYSVRFAFCKGRHSCSAEIGQEGTGVPMVQPSRRLCIPGRTEWRGIDTFKRRSRIRVDRTCDCD